MGPEEGIQLGRRADRKDGETAAALPPVVQKDATQPALRRYTLEPVPISVEGLDPCSAWGLTFRMGGTNISIALHGCKPHTGEAVERSSSLTWKALEPELRSQPAADPRAILYARLAAVTAELIETSRLNPSVIKFASMGVAGPVVSGRVTTTNTAVDLTQVPIGEQLLSALRENPGTRRLGVSEVAVVNDGVASALGEACEPRGALCDLGEGRIGGIEIMGTGDGGAAIMRRGRRYFTVKEIAEFGHIGVYNVQSRSYECFPLKQLEELGKFKDGEFFGPPAGYHFREHRLAGPWLCRRLLENLSPELVFDFAQMLCPCGPEGADAHFMERARQLGGRLLTIRDFPQDRLHEIAKLPGGEEIFKQVNEVFSRMSERDLSIDGAIEGAGEIYRRLWWFRSRYARECGQGLRAISDIFPEMEEIVCVSTVYERLGAHLKFQEAVRREFTGSKAVVKFSSHGLTGAARENAGLTLGHWLNRERRR